MIVEKAAAALAALDRHKEAIELENPPNSAALLKAVSELQRDTEKLLAWFDAWARR